MILSNNIQNYKVVDIILCKCDLCSKEFERTLKNIRCSRKKRNYEEKDYCQSCACKLSISPQKTKEYWTDDKKLALGNSIKNSDNYKIAIKSRDITKDKNGMYGKTHSKETLEKMSISRRGKIGEKATNWQGGKNSLTKRVKGYIHRNLHWYGNVYKRDSYKCVKCNSIDKIDAHHIIPMVVLIRELLLNKCFSNDNEKYLYLIEQPEIVDIDLKNGITLCRICHKKEHKNWGSKISP